MAPTREFEELVLALLRPAILKDLTVLVACLFFAWGLVWLLRGRRADQDSVWFGKRIVDGVLFPMVALALAFGAKAALVEWVQPAVFKLAIPILLSLAAIRLVVRVLSASFPDSGWLRRVERSFSWLAWLLLVLWVTGLLPMMLDAMEEVRFKIGSTRLTLRNVVEGSLTAIVVMVLALWIAAAIEKKLLRGSGDNLSVRKMAANLVRVMLLVAGLLVGLSAVGIDLTALSVLGGAIGVGLGFGLQKITANYVSGFVILAERSLRIGDMVKLDTFEGRITDIRTRYTLIRALNGRESIVPNELLITQRVENASLADPKVMLTTVVTVAYGTDVRALQAPVVQAIQGIARVLSDPAPALMLTDFVPDGLALTLFFWIADPENGQASVRSDVNLALLELLDERGIDIPFPQRVVYQKDAPETRLTPPPSITLPG
ncbi:MAG: mechanosensitive ion channel domain-containing protein [Pseudomonadota bacterium]